MDSVHDMGGMHGFGPIPINDDAVFSHDWQKRAFALTEALAWSVPFTADQHRFAIERIPAADYLSRDYFEKWLIAAQTLMCEAGLVDLEELITGRKRFDVTHNKHAPVEPDTLTAATKAGANLSYPSENRTAKFEVDQPVRALVSCPSGHTRAPRYLRGRVGRIVANLGVFQFADAVAAGRGPCPQHCYTVEFDAAILWGKDAEENEQVYADLWEDYLEPA